MCDHVFVYEDIVPDKRHPDLVAWQYQCFHCKKRKKKNTSSHIKFQVGKKKGFYEFSNLWPAEIEIKGKKYNSVEHYVLAKRCKSAYDREFILMAKDAVRAREFAKLEYPSQGFLENRDRYLLRAMKAKFRQHKDLGELLLSTGNKPIVEISKYNDMFEVSKKEYRKIDDLLIKVRRILYNDMKE